MPTTALNLARPVKAVAGIFISSLEECRPCLT